MNKKKVTIIDYKCGNIFSLMRILKEFNCSVQVSENFDEISKAEKLVLPGVGSFSLGISNIKAKNLDKAILSFLDRGNYLLGICLGMQLLVSESDEFGSHKGLNLIAGKATKLKKDKNVKIPHTGWNTVNFNENNLNSSDQKKLFYEIKNNSNFYFTHSYATKTSSKTETWARSKYGNNNFSSIIGRENIIGCQFHPEKSGDIGQTLIKNFLSL